MAKAHSRKKAGRFGGESSQRVDEERFWQVCATFRPEIALAGYWSSLQENCDQWADEIVVSPFWKAVKDRQLGWSNAFQQKTSGALLASPGIPNFVSKNVARVREKLFHKWSQDPKSQRPEEFWPKEGPPVPLVNDLVRTRVECQFLDGVEFFTNCLQELASEIGLKVSRERQGRIQGYFAQHFCFQQKIFFRFGGSEEPTIIQCEVQIATALATRIWEESHKTYEHWRVQAEEAEDWQWSPTDPRFIARQLGHMIHLADGLLVQLRNSSNKHI